MRDLLLMLIMCSWIAAIVGLFKPSLVYHAEKPTRGKAFITYALISLVLFAVGVAIGPEGGSSNPKRAAQVGGQVGTAEQATSKPQPSMPVGAAGGAR